MNLEILRDPAQRRVLLLTVILFVAYLCVAIPLPVVPVYVARELGLGNVWAGLAVGAAFFSTIVTRGHAGLQADRRGPRRVILCGFAYYTAGTLVSAAAGWLTQLPWTAYTTLVVGRLLLGLGESLVGVGLIVWGVGIMGPAHSGKVLALIGAFMYGALAVGGPLGLALLDWFGFAGAMTVGALLPCLGWLAIWRMTDTAPVPATQRPSFWKIISKIWLHGMVICLQGIGFAAIGAFFVLYFLSEGWAYAGLGLTAFGVGFVLVRILFGGLPDRLGGLPVAAGALAVEALGQLLIWLAHDSMLALAGAFLTGLGCSMVFPAMGREVVYLVRPQLRGTALGGFAAFQDLAYGLTGPVAGLLADRAGYGSVFLVGGMAAGIGCLIVFYLRRVHGSCKMSV